MDILETYFKEKQSDWYEITTLTQCFFNLTPSRQELHGLLLTESATDLGLLLIPGALRSVCGAGLILAHIYTSWR